MKVFHSTVMPETSERGDDTVTALSRCPVPACGSLVIEYRPADNIRLGHPGNWEFTCSRCGSDFSVPQGELIFQSVPKQWLSASTSHSVSPWPVKSR
jgi:hypothetical protein